jgi:glutamate racemase
VASLIAEAAGPGVTIVDTGPAVARRLADVMVATGLARADRLPGLERFWTTGDLAVTAPVVAKLWGARDVPLLPLPVAAARP